MNRRLDDAKNWDAHTEDSRAPPPSRPVMLSLCALAISLVVPTAPRVGVAAPCAWTASRLVRSHRASGIALCAANDADAENVQQAAERVVAVAKQFGSEQGAAAIDWVSKAASSGADSEELLKAQLALFEGCIIDDEDEDAGAKCIELDSALAELEEASGTVDTSSSRMERAAARVRVAASKFGPLEKKAAEVWVAEVRENGGANPAALLEQQVSLFGECILEEDGSGSGRCRELQEALTALQASLGIGGRVVSLRGLMPPDMLQPKGASTSTDDGLEPPPPEGFEWGESH